MEHNPEAAKAFTQAAAQNITEMDYWDLSYIMERNPEAVNLFTQAAAENITEMDHRALLNIMERNPEAVNLFTQAAAENIHQISAVFLDQLLKRITAERDNQENLRNIERALKQAITTSTDASFNTKLKQIIYFKYFRDTKPQTNSLSQTEQHMIANLDAIFNFMKNAPSDLIEPLFEQVTKIETDLQQKGYYTFVHGQRWEYRLVENWYTKLWSLKNRKSVQDYLFAHVKPQPTTAQLEQDNVTREQLMRVGRTDGASRQKLLFMNYALFGNATNLGSSSADYMASNNNAGNVAISLRETFDHLGYQDIYAKYKEELTQLENEHKELSKYGNLLLVGVPQDKLPECVYLSLTGGAKRTIEIKGVGKTDDIKLIMDTLRTNPEKIWNSDQLEFCMAMTWDMALNPESGIKIFSLNAADQEKLVAFNAKSDELFARIKRDICGDDVIETPVTPIEELSIFDEPHPAFAFEG